MNGQMILYAFKSGDRYVRIGDGALHPVDMQKASVYRSLDEIRALREGYPALQQFSVVEMAIVEREIVVSG